MPPTSAWWPRLAVKKRSSPRASCTGVTTVMSGRCEPPAAGSLVTNTSPGARVRVRGVDGAHRLAHRAQVHGDVRRVRDQSGVAVEHRAGEVEPLADVGRDRGAAQHRAHLLGDRHEQVVHDLEPDRIDLARRARSGRLAGQIGEDDAPLRVERELEARIDDQGAGRFEHQRRAGQHRAGRERLALVDRDVLAERAVAEDARQPARARRGARRGCARLRARRLRHGPVSPEHLDPRDGRLDRLLGARVAERARVRGVEALAQRAGPVERERERGLGAHVAQVESRNHRDPRGLEALGREHGAPARLELREGLLERALEAGRERRAGRCPPRRARRRRPGPSRTPRARRRAGARARAGSRAGARARRRAGRPRRRTRPARTRARRSRARPRPAGSPRPCSRWRSRGSRSRSPRASAAHPARAARRPGGVAPSAPARAAAGTGSGRRRGARARGSRR